MNDPLEHDLEAALNECERACQSNPINTSGIKTAVEKARSLFLKHMRLKNDSTIFWRWFDFAVHTAEEPYGPEITHVQKRMAKFLIEIGSMLDPTIGQTARDLAEKSNNAEIVEHVDFVKDITDANIDPAPFVRIKAHLEKEGVTVDPKSIKTWSLFLSAVHYLSPHRYSNKDEKGVDWTEEKNAIARLLVEKGLDVKATNAGRGTNQETPLILAAHAGNVAIVQFLVDEKKAKVNATDSMGKTALDYAKENNDPDPALMNYLKSKGAKPGKKSKHIAADHPALTQAHPQPPTAQPKGLLSRLLGKK